MFEFDAQRVTENLEALLRCFEERFNQRPDEFRDWDQFIAEARKPEAVWPDEFMRTYDGQINLPRKLYVQQTLRELPPWETPFDPPPADPPPSFRQQLVDHFVVAEVTDRLNNMVRNGTLRTTQRDFVLDWFSKDRPNPCSDFDDNQSPQLFQPSVNANLAGQFSFQPGTWAPFPLQDMSILPDIAQSVQAWTADRDVQLRWSNQTTLVRTLRGDFLPDLAPGLDRGQLEERTLALFRAHAVAFAGNKQARVALEDTFGRIVRLRQTSVEETPIPVYGGVLITNYNSTQQATFLNNSCYPLPEKGFHDRFHINQEKAKSIAKAWVAFMHEKGDNGEQRLWAEPGDNFLKGEEAGKVILPAVLVNGRVTRPRDLDDLAKKSVEHDYLPAWAIAVYDELNVRSWMVLVDAERTDGLVEERVLYGTETTVGDTIHALGYPTIAHAIFADLGLRDLALVSPTTLLVDADSFQLVNASEPLPNQFSREANAYYHLSKALIWFLALLPLSWPELANGPLPAVPGSANTPRVKVKFSNADGGAQLTTSTVGATLLINKGTTSAQPPVGDPAMDAEVLYHEFTHGVMHQVQPDLNNKVLNSSFRRSIEEGLAFYFACSISDDLTGSHQDVQPFASQLIPHRWAKLARKDAGWTNTGLRDLERWGSFQRADSDYLKVYGVFPLFSEGIDDPDQEDYAVGMAWARTLWDIRRVLGSSWANRIILRAARLAGGVQADLETWAEAIIHADSELTPAGAVSHETALRAIFAARGILADAPIRNIEAVDLGGQQVLLATVDGAGSGCLISLDHGDTWSPLGSAGPANSEAMCCLQLNAHEALVFVADESWMSHAAGQNAVSVYSYRLEPDAQGNLIINGTWDRLPLLNSAAAIRCLVATTSGPGVNQPLLFAGAENGIYMNYAGVWQVTTIGQPQRHVPNRLTKPVHALGIAIIDGAQRLLAATETGLQVFDTTTDAAGNPTGLALSQALVAPAAKPVFCIATAPDQPGQNTERIWLGTIQDGVIEMDLTAAPGNLVTTIGQWRRNTVVVPAPPVFRLRSIPSAGGHILQAGTSSGVYERPPNGDWQAQTQGFAPGAETLDNVAVLSLAAAGARLLVGTGQRGLWMRENGVWQRAQGLPRIGVLSDALDPQCNCFHGSLPASAVASYVIFVAPPQRGSLTLSLQVTGGAVRTIKLFYVTPAIDKNRQQWAGSQDRTLNPVGANTCQLQEPVLPGHYVVVVQADSQPITTYQLDVAVLP